MPLLSIRGYLRGVPLVDLCLIWFDVLLEKKDHLAVGDKKEKW